jgi:hypothetical protein
MLGKSMSTGVEEDAMVVVDGEGGGEKEATMGLRVK